MKLIESHIKTRVGFHNRMRKRSLAYKQSKLLSKKASRTVGDGIERILKTGPLDETSVLAYGDLDDQAFGKTADGKVTVVGGGSYTPVIEQHFSTQNIEVLIRKLDATVVYMIDGKGNYPGPHTIELAAGSIEEDLRPNKPVIVPLRTTEAAHPDEIGMSSNAYAEVRPSGAIEVYCESGFALSEDFPMTTAEIQAGQGVTERVWDTPHLRIEVRGDNPLLQFSVTGKNTGTLASGTYTELDAGSLGEYTPLATGPTVILRTDGDEDNAAVDIKKDGSVILTVHKNNCILDDSSPVTCTYLNVVEENVLTYQVTNTYRTIYLKKQDDLIVMQYEQNAEEVLDAGAFKPIWNGDALKGHEEFLPDNAVLLDLEEVPGTGVFLNEDGAYLANFTGSEITVNPFVPVGVPHLNMAADVSEQNLECPHCELQIRSGDNSEVVYSATSKGTTPNGEITLFPAGTIDPDFTPSEIDGFVTVPLTNADHSGKDSFLKIFADGLVKLIGAGVQLATGAESKNNVLYVDPEDQEVVGHKLVGDHITLDVSQDGDLNVYSVEANTASITGGEEFRPGSIAPEFCPPEDVTMEIPCRPGSGLKHAYVTVHVDGSVSVTPGQVLQEGADAMACGWSMKAAALQVEQKYGVNVDIIARKCDGILTYTLNVKNANVPAGTTDELSSGDLISEDFRPDHDTLCEIITTSSSGLDDRAYAIVKPDGHLRLTSSGQPLNTAYNSHAVTIYDPDPTTEEVDEATYRTAGDTFHLDVRKIGAIVTYEAAGDGSTAYIAGNTNIFPVGTVDAEYLPEEPIVLNLRTYNGTEGDAFFILMPDGSGVLTTSEPTQISPLVTNTCRCLLWQDDLKEQEIDLTQEVSRQMRLKGAGDFSGWLKLKFRRLKEAIHAILQGTGTISADFNISGTPVDVAFRPDTGFNIEINKGATGGGGHLKVGADGSLDFGFRPSVTSLVLDVNRKMMCPFMQYGDGDIFTGARTTLLEKRALPVHALELHNRDLEHTTGKMYYHSEYMHPVDGRSVVILQTRRRLLIEYAYGNWFTDICSKAWSFIKTNVDLKAIGNTLLKAGGSIVTGLISGKGLGQSIKGAFQEVAAGGISKYLRPDSPVASAIQTVDGAASAAMKLLPSGAAQIVTKATNTIANSPVGSTFINLWRGTGPKTEMWPMTLKNEPPRNYQTIDDVVSVEAIRHGMIVVYHIDGKQAELKKGSYKLEGVLMNALCPDHDMEVFINIDTVLHIHKNGSIVIIAAKDTALSNLVIPATTILMPKTVVDITDIQEFNVPTLDEVDRSEIKITRRVGRNKLKNKK